LVLVNLKFLLPIVDTKVTTDMEYYCVFIEYVIKGALVELGMRCSIKYKFDIDKERLPNLHIIIKKKQAIA
jgi:hypothetical protein